jgi:hypothetical protein
MEVGAGSRRGGGVEVGKERNPRAVTVPSSVPCETSPPRLRHTRHANATQRNASSRSPPAQGEPHTATHTNGLMLGGR